MIKACPECKASLQLMSNGKLRCRKCRRTYESVPEFLLLGTVFKRLRIFRWVAYGFTALFIAFSAFVLPSKQVYPSVSYLLNAGLAIGFGTAIITYIYWILQLNAELSSDLRTVSNNKLNRPQREAFQYVISKVKSKIKECAIVLIIVTSTELTCLLAIVHDSAGQVAVLNLIFVLAAFILHFIVLIWDQWGTSIITGIIASAGYDTEIVSVVVERWVPVLNSRDRVFWQSTSIHANLV